MSFKTGNCRFRTALQKYTYKNRKETILLPNMRTLTFDRKLHTKMKHPKNFPDTFCGTPEMA
jgi:hypothetical protein